MEIIKFIAYILLVVYFLYKVIAGLIVLFKYDVTQIQKELPSIKNKRIYIIGFIEHLFYLTLVNLLYFLN